MSTQKSACIEQEFGPRDRLLVGYFLKNENHKIIARLEREAGTCKDRNGLFPIFEFIPIDVGCKNDESDESTRIDFFIFKPSEEFSLISMSHKDSDRSNEALQRLGRLHEIEAQVPTFATLRNVLPTFHRQTIAHSIEHITQALNDKGLHQFGTLKWKFVKGISDQQKFHRALQDVGFPVIIKTGIATGIEGAHDVIVATDLESASKIIMDSNLVKLEGSSPVRVAGSLDLSVASAPKSLCFIDDICAETCGEGIILQEYIPNHGGIVYKLYVVGSKRYVVLKRSLPIIQEQLTPGKLPIFLSELQIRAFSSPVSSQENDHTLSAAVISTIAEEAQVCMDLCIFGIDFIFDIDKNKFYLVDINFFPSFRGVPDGQKHILDYIYSHARSNSKL